MTSDHNDVPLTVPSSRIPLLPFEITCLQKQEMIAIDGGNENRMYVCELPLSFRARYFAAAFAKKKLP